MVKHAVLRMAIRSQGSYEDAAEVLGLSTQGLIAKLDGRVPWKLAEAYLLKEWLQVSDDFRSLFPVGDQTIVSRRK